MSHDANVTPSAPVSRPAADDAPEAVRWIKCRGCGGEVGIPPGWGEPSVDCPECGASVQVHGKVLYRPPSTVQALGAPLPAPVQIGALSVRKAANLELERAADKTMICGILSVALGWTVLVPLFGLCYHSEASAKAKEEGIPVPTKATVGLLLCLLFGAVQGLAVIAHLSK